MTRSSGMSSLQTRDAIRLEQAPPPPSLVERVAQLTLLRELRWYGQGVGVAVLDDGINGASLRAKLRAAPLAHGASPIFELQHSRVPGIPEPFSRTRRSHGSMCAYDVCLAAPGCTLLDFPVLAPRGVGRRRLDDILAVYRRVVDLLRRRVFRHIVVVNAWQTLPSDERLGMRTDDPNHPLYRALSELDAAGADVLFAAPDHHAKRIHGPALHPGVLTVAAVNLDGTPFESSVAREFRHASTKPDVSNYQGFSGYELFRNQRDYGTSAATALTAGMVAAVRSAPRARGKSPGELRRWFRQSSNRAEAAEVPAATAMAEPGIVDLGRVLAQL